MIDIWQPSAGLWYSNGTSYLGRFVGVAFVLRSGFFAGPLGRTRPTTTATTNTATPPTNFLSIGAFCFRIVIFGFGGAAFTTDFLPLPCCAGGVAVVPGSAAGRGFRFGEFAMAATPDDGDSGFPVVGEPLNSEGAARGVNFMNLNEFF